MTDYGKKKVTSNYKITISKLFGEYYFMYNCPDVPPYNEFVK